MTTVRFIVETAAEPFLILSRNDRNEKIDLVPSSGPKREGRAEVEPGVECLLLCVFAGKPGTKYKVALEPKAQLDVQGSNPIESAISTQLNHGSVGRRFRVRP